MTDECVPELGAGEDWHSPTNALQSRGGTAVVEWVISPSPQILQSRSDLLCNVCCLGDEFFEVLAIGKIRNQNSGLHDFVVAEELKRRFNRGEEADAYFYRNSSGTVEVDLIVENEGKIHPMEIKSSTTFSDSMLKGLRSFASLCPEAERGRVVYSGETMPLAANFADTDAWCV